MDNRKYLEIQVEEFLADDKNFDKEKIKPVELEWVADFRVRDELEKLANKINEIIERFN